MSESKFLTRAAWRAIGLAGQEARRHHHHPLRAVHLLLGLMSVEDGLARRVLHDLGVEIHHLQVLIERVRGSPAESPQASREPYAQIMPVFWVANGEAEQRGHSYVDTEHLLLGLIHDPEGRETLQQLGLSPEQVRDHLDHVLQEVSAQAPETRSLFASSLEAFLTPDFTPDIKKLFMALHFPFRVLANTSLAFRLCKCEFGRAEAAQTDVITHIFFEFARPFCVASTSDGHEVQWLGIDNWSERERGTHRLWTTMERLGRKVKEDDQFRLPPEFAELLGQTFQTSEALMAAASRWQHLLGDARWESSVASGLHFTAAHWDGGRMPVGWAYSSEEEPFIVIATLGVSRPDFLEILGSLVILQPDDESLISKFQAEMKTAKEERRRSTGRGQ